MQLRGVVGKDAEIKLEGATPGNFQRFIITLKGRKVTVQRNDQEMPHLLLPTDAPARGPFGLRDTGGALEFMNLYVREL